MASSRSRPVWKGAISFGLVNVPVAVHTATRDTRAKMHLFDAQSGAPVGYQKVDKRTGQALDEAEIVKGMKVDPGQLVTLGREEIRQALPQATQTIEIESFVRLEDVPTAFYDKPYYTSPIRHGEKAYALLRDVLRRTGRAGLGRVVIATKQHLALVTPHEDGLVLNLLRWADELRDMHELLLPATASQEGVSERELAMGEQLVLNLSDAWHPERFHDEFRDKVQALVQAKRRAGDVTRVPDAAQAPTPEPALADAMNLAELLRKSLSRALAPGAGAPRPAASRGATRKAGSDEAATQRAVAAAKPRRSGKPPRNKGE